MATREIFSMFNREHYIDIRSEGPNNPLDWGIEVFYNELNRATAAEIFTLMSPLVKAIREHDMFVHQTPSLHAADGVAEYHLFARRGQTVGLYIDEDDIPERQNHWLIEFGARSIHLMLHIERFNGSPETSVIYVPDNKNGIVNETILPRLHNAALWLLPSD